MTVYSRNFYKRKLVRNALRYWKLFNANQIRDRERTRWGIKISQEMDVIKKGIEGL